jgi:hypothetical protein
MLKGMQRKKERKEVLLVKAMNPFFLQKAKAEYLRGLDGVLDAVEREVRNQGERGRVARHEPEPAGDDGHSDRGHDEFFFSLFFILLSNIHIYF